MADQRVHLQVIDNLKSSATRTPPGLANALRLQCPLPDFYENHFFRLQSEREASMSRRHWSCSWSSAHNSMGGGSAVRSCPGNDRGNSKLNWDEKQCRETMHPGLATCIIRVAPSSWLLQCQPHRVLRIIKLEVSCTGNTAGQ